MTSDKRLELSPKYKAFLRCHAPLEILEGTTAAGKTTVGLHKFILRVWESQKQLHILAADDTGAAEKNIIQRELGILDDFGPLVEYRGNGSTNYKMPHLILHATSGDKIIFIVGYRDKTRWKDALGGQYGCLYIDEINTANIDFVREAVMRADYVMGTLNPDDPDLPVYREYINRCRPDPKWADDTPEQIRKELEKEPEHPGWVHWFFSFDDNLGLTQEEKDRIIGNVPKGTKLWKNKVQGLRGRATGLVFPNFEEERHVLTEEAFRALAEDDKGYEVVQVTSGLDTAYSATSPDTIAMTCQGITRNGTLVYLEEDVTNNADKAEPFAPSDIAERYDGFLTYCATKWGMFKNAFVDSADQATLTELAKYKRSHTSQFVFNPSYKIPIIDRINLQAGWLQTGHYLVLAHNKEHIRELNTYSYDDKGKPEDGNDHTINSDQYGWTPFVRKVGQERNQ